MSAEKTQTYALGGRRGNILLAAAGVFLISCFAIAAFWYAIQYRKPLYLEDARVQAPHIILAPTTTGTVKDIPVAVGDTLSPGTIVARVGNQLMRSTNGGLVVSIDSGVGKVVDAGTPVVTVIDPTQLRVVGKVRAGKTGSGIAVGDRAVFQADVLPGRNFEGVIESVNPILGEGEAAYVSGTARVQAYAIEISYDRGRYPQLKDGMKAHARIYSR